MKYGPFTTLNIPKCERFTLLECPFQFLGISALRRLGNVQGFKKYMFCFWAFGYERDPGWAGYPTSWRLNGKLSLRLTVTAWQTAPTRVTPPLMWTWSR